MNPARPCMLAFMMNGELLHPDHGYPVRLLMPGYIGGRMIKWLSTISVTEEEGDNHYHVYDNRVFPKASSPEMTSQRRASGSRATTRSTTATSTRRSGALHTAPRSRYRRTTR